MNILKYLKSPSSLNKHSTLKAIDKNLRIYHTKETGIFSFDNAIFIINMHYYYKLRTQYHYEAVLSCVTEFGFNLIYTSEFNK